MRLMRTVNNTSGRNKRDNPNRSYGKGLPRGVLRVRGLRHTAERRGRDESLSAGQVASVQRVSREASRDDSARPGAHELIHQYQDAFENQRLHLFE